jgi:hypothetical protein
VRRNGLMIGRRIFPAVDVADPNWLVNFGLIQRPLDGPGPSGPRARPTTAPALAANAPGFRVTRSNSTGSQSSKAGAEEKKEEEKKEETSKKKK